MKLLSASNDGDIAIAAQTLSAGGLVAFPTETVYGLGGDAFNPAALARIFEAKNRPFFDPLIIHIAGLSALDALVLWKALDGRAKDRLDLLAKNFWPGPLTLILPKRPELPDLANAGLPNAAIRFPSHPAAQALIRLSTGAIAAPSANPFGSLSPTRAEHVVAGLGNKVDIVLDGGRTGTGLESTVLDITTEPCRLLRPGGVPRESIEALVGPLAVPAAGSNDEASPSPGRLKSHYAPAVPLCLHKPGRLARAPLLAREGRLYFSAPCLPAGPDIDRVKILSPKGELREAAANFFDMLHELDSLDLDIINAEEAPPHGLGEAINDRLRRAAARG